MTETYTGPKLPWLNAFQLVVLQLPYTFEQVRRKEYRTVTDVAGGQCYAASEAVFHLSQDPLEVWSFRFGEEAHKTHWFLKTMDGTIVDPTASQFPRNQLFAHADQVEREDDKMLSFRGQTYLTLYDMATRRGFLTKGPSKRARVILDRIDFNASYRIMSTAETEDSNVKD